MYIYGVFMARDILINQGHTQCTKADIEFLEREFNAPFAIFDSVILKWNSISKEFANRLSKLLCKPMEKIDITFYCDDKDAINSVNTALCANEKIRYLGIHLLGPDTEISAHKSPTPEPQPEPDLPAASSVEQQNEVAEDGWLQGLDDWIANASMSASVATAALQTRAGSLLNRFQHLNLACVPSFVTDELADDDLEPDNPETKANIKKGQ